MTCHGVNPSLAHITSHRYTLHRPSISRRNFQTLAWPGETNNTSYFPHIFCEFDSFVYSSQQVIDIIRTRPGGSTNNSNTRHKNIKYAQHINLGTFSNRSFVLSAGHCAIKQLFIVTSVLRCPDPLRIC